MLEITVQDQINSPLHFPCPFCYNMSYTPKKSCSSKKVNGKNRSFRFITLLNKEFQ